METKTRIIIAFCFGLVCISSLFLFDLKLYCVEHDVNGTWEKVCFSNSEEYEDYANKIIKKINENTISNQKSIDLSFFDSSLESNSSSSS